MSEDRIPSSYPYLKEKASGYVHMYMPSLAERTDLVVGCMSLDGSDAPESAGSEPASGDSAVPPAKPRRQTK